MTETRKTDEQLLRLREAQANASEIVRCLARAPDPLRTSSGILAWAVERVVRDEECSFGKILGVIAHVTVERYSFADPVNLETSAEWVADPLLWGLLRSEINTQPAIEDWARAVRRALLYRHNETGDLPERQVSLAVAIAHQCFNNEYLYPESDVEKGCLAPVLSAAAARRPLAAADVAVLAMYRPLVDTLSEPLDSSDFAPDVEELVRRLFREPLRERALARALPEIRPIERSTSLAVQAQYIENPYPRWVRLPTSEPLEKRMTRWGRRVPDRPRVLVAGSGSGQHPLMFAAANPKAHVLAVDLSPVGLAHAQRAANDRGITNIEFLVGDLLDLPELSREFDVITCVGVLHHLADPLAGWHALRRVLAPKGLLQVGVYSRVARLPIAAARADIEELGLEANAAEIRNYREQLRCGERGRLWKILQGSHELYYLSGMRDLLFHVQEHRVNTRTLIETAESVGLEFVAFEARRALRSKYRELFPDDPGCRSIANWIKFEPQYAATRALLQGWWQAPS